jgi:hypothetical protein
MTKVGWALGIYYLTLLNAEILSRAGAREDLAQAAQSLASKNNYTWITTFEGGQLPNATLRAMVDASGVIYCSVRFEEADVDVVIKGDQRFVKTEKGWKSAASLLPSGEGSGQPEPAVMAAIFSKTIRPPAVEIKSLAGMLPTVETNPTGGIDAKMTEDSIKVLPILLPTATEPRLEKLEGVAQFFLKDHLVNRYAIKYSGLIKGPFGELDLRRTNTTVISEIGSTRVDLPAEVQKLLDAAKK